MDTTLKELIEKLGVDPSFFQEGGASLFGKSIGLKGKGLKGFSDMANISPFNPDQYKDMLESISDYGEEQTGYVKEQFSSGTQNLRDMLTSSMQKTREGSSVRGGRFGAMQKQLNQMSQGAESKFGQLGQKFSQGMGAVSQQVDARTGVVQGLLGDYISRLTGLGSQFLSFDPANESYTSSGGTTVTGRDQGELAGLTDYQE